MRSKLLAVALATTVPSMTLAQSTVSVYGVVDTAVAREDTDAPGVGARYVLNSGNQSSSRLGFRGTEDLGGGLNAIFNLEAGISLDSGNVDALFFGRRSVVGLTGPFGQVVLGREYTPNANVAAATDILGQGFYGTNLSAFTGTRLTRRQSNAVAYRTPSFGGVRINAMYGAGEGAPGRLRGGGVEYSAGSLYLGAGYHSIQGVTGQDKEYSLGVGYTFAGFDVKANYLADNPDGPANKFEQWNLGASTAFATGRIYANLQQNKLENGARGKAYAIAYSYSLSKRTNLYTSYAKLSNNSTGAFGLSSASTNVTPATAPAAAAAAARGTDPSVFVLGMRHTF